MPKLHASMTFIYFTLCCKSSIIIIENESRIKLKEIIKMMTCKTLTNKLNEVNNTNDIKVVKESGYYIIKCGGYESEFCYTLKELVNEVAAKETIKMVYRSWTMSGIKTTTIKGVC